MKKFLRSPYFIITSVVLLVYGWALSFGFLYYDDHIHVFENQPLISGHILYFWKTAHEGLYVPLVYTIWALLFKIFGLNPAAFHATGILFHAANAMLVFSIVENFRFSRESSLFAALLFAVHPIQVESVVWVSALKDTSFAFFSLVAVWIYLFYRGNRVLKWTAGFVAVCAAILCKPTAVVLPVIISVYLLLGITGRFSERLRLLLKMIGPLPLTLLLGFFAVGMARSEQGWSGHPNTRVSLFERPIIALDSIGFYLKKIFIPSEFYVDYAKYPRNVLDNHLYYLNAAIALLFIGGLVYFLWRKRFKISPAAVFAMLLGFLFYLPTSGVVTFGHQKISTTADRYMYLVMAAVAIGAAIVLEAWRGKALQKSAGKVSVIILVGLSALSFMQLINWKDIAVFTDNLYEGNPNNYYANRNLGLFLQLKGEDEKALEFFQRAQEIDPNHLSARAAIVSLYFNRREYEKMDKYIAENLTEEKLRGLQQTAFETHAFFMAVAESYLERKNYTRAMFYLCKAKRLGVVPFTAEVSEKINSVKKLDAEAAATCVD